MLCELVSAICYAGAMELQDLTLDDSLPDHDRIAKYATSAIALQRLVHVKLMAETARDVGYVLPRLVSFAGMLTFGLIGNRKRPAAFETSMLAYTPNRQPEPF